MAGNKDIINIQSYKSKNVWNVGLILFGVVFIYLAVTVVTYITKERVAAYEVREGTILKDNALTGIVIRDELVVKADSDGYVNYFASAGSKAAVGSNICTVSPAQLPTAENTEENQEVSLSTEDWNNIVLKTQTFNEVYDSDNFKTAQVLKDEVTSVVQNNTAQNRVSQLNTFISEGSIEGLAVLQSPSDGIIEYGIDGYEELELSEIDESHLLKDNYARKEHQNNTEIKAGEPIYKLITNEEWTVVVKLTKELEEQYNNMYDVDQQKYAEVRFAKDNEVLWAKLEIYNKGKDDAYGFLTFSTAMIRYAGERFLDIELILEDQTGLKVPKSSIIEKDFYVVPDSFLTAGGASKESGVLRKSKGKDGTSLTEFVAASIFYRDTENGLVYLAKDTFEDGQVLVMPDSETTMTLSEKRPLKGVYNINKGYAVFKQVKILCESEEYYIVEEGNSYGLSNYDHIALNGKSVMENDIVSQ